MADPFTIGINLKPYARKYLVNKFGDPVNLYCNQGKELKQTIIKSLQKPSYRFDKRIDLLPYDETRFVISKSDFYRYGWDISKTDMIRFNNMVEAEIKLLSRTFISFDKSFGVPIGTAIRNFQTEFNFTEEEFPYDTIRKDFDRNGDYINFKYLADIIKTFKRKFVEQLSEIRQA